MLIEMLEKRFVTVPRVQAEGTETAEQISKLENKMVCPNFGGSVEFGSYDPYEGEYYWCEACGKDPILRRKD
jgi:hypothetical protein